MCVVAAEGLQPMVRVLWQCINLRHFGVQTELARLLTTGLRARTVPCISANETILPFQWTLGSISQMTLLLVTETCSRVACRSCPVWATSPPAQGVLTWMSSCVYELTDLGIPSTHDH